LGVLAVLHDLNQVARFDRLVLLDRGRVAGEGPPERILDAALLSRVYRTPVRVLPGPPPFVTTG
jgi:iron complex transport system ATP-binding protein